MMGDLLLVFVALGSLVWTVHALHDKVPDVSPKRPSVSIYVDRATGCEYLSGRGLTPRLDGQGRHMGCR